MIPRDAAQSPTPPLVTVEGFRLGGGTSPAVLATFSVRIGRGFLVHGVRLVEGRNGGRFLGWPQRKDPDSGTWSPIIEVPPAISTATEEQAQAAYEAATAVQAVPQRDDYLDDLPF